MKKKILYKKKVIVNFLNVVLALLGNWVNICERVSSTLESTLYKSNLGFQYSIKGIKFLFLGVARMPYNEKKNAGLCGRSIKRAFKKKHKAPYPNFLTGFGVRSNISLFGKYTNIAISH